MTHSLLSLKLLTQERTKSISLQISLDQVTSEKHKEIKKLKKEHERLTKESQEVSLVMFRKFAACFEKERNALEDRYNEVVEKLRDAVYDIEHLMTQNAELEKRLLQASMWEPRM